ncbi:MAG: HEAT repeat domain-containing protein [Verrucomicrobia bacterium]|nr:HEAT repeat domain-containing protein [Verrucomicrobiota bacterium]
MSLRHPLCVPARAALLAGISLAFASLGAHAAEKVSPPDLTQGGMPDQSHDWTLGPTGARGWIYSASGHTGQARQILITAVAKDSPADEILDVGDVILGVDGHAFSSDARIRFAQAITAAETDRGSGRLRLTRWRDGQTQAIILNLPVLGAYSATAPYDCEKSRRIFENGCQALAKRMASSDYGRKLNPIPRSLNALALLARGDANDLPALQKEAKWAADFSADGFATWYYGYALTFLAEYVMATGDQSVAPGMKRLAMEAARGQSAVGTWGHKFALPNGNLNGYGCMNQPGLSLCIGMVLAREAGVHEPHLDQAIGKAAGFLRWFVNKGAIPYGDHRPWPGHEDNGKCSSGAVLFDLLGDREAAGFYARMSAAAYSEREQGHTGNFFNILWAMPGVARCGPLATGAYWREQSWYYDLARGWDGTFIYQGSPVGEEEHGSYKGWDSTGCYLLAYALPRKSLRLTGRKPFSAPSLDAAQTEAVIAAGRDYGYKDDKNAYDRRTTEQLLAGLSSWSPAVRTRSAKALGRREGDFVPALTTLLAGPDRNARYGACEALGSLGPRADAAAPQLRAALKDSDPWLQSMACMAIPPLGPEARKASVSDLLRMTLNPNPADPRRMVQRAASMALFSPYPGSGGPKSILAESLEGVDRQLLYPAVKSLLQNEDSVVRGSVDRVFKHLSDRDLVALLPAVVKATEQLAPSNEMFGDGIRLAGLDLLSRLHIREGIPLCVSLIEPERWGSGNRLPKCLEYLVRYGTHAKTYLPQLREMRETLAKSNPRGSNNDRIAKLDKTLSEIESSATTPTVLELREFMANPTPAGKNPKR